VELLGLIVLGVVIGGILGLVGAGGSILAVPGFIFVLNLSPHQATLAGAMVVGLAALTGAVRRIRRGEADIRVGALFSISGLLGTVIGARVSNMIDEQIVALLFSGVIVVAAMSMWRTASYEYPRQGGAVRAGLAATLVGLLTGIFGIGGGFLIVPALVLVMNVPARLATGTSLVAISLNSAAALLLRLDQINTIPLTSVLLVAITAVVTSAIATQRGLSLSGDRVQQLFSILLIAIAALLLIQSVSV
jgi:uncharacterized membrane protein YfcA